MADASDLRMKYFKFQKEHPWLAGVLETIHGDPGLSPVPLSLGIPQKYVAQLMMSRKLNDAFKFEGNKIKTLLYRFQREDAPAKEVYRRGGEYYYPGRPGTDVRVDYKILENFGEGGNVLKVAPTEIKNPIIKYVASDYPSSIKTLGGQDTYIRVSEAINLMNNPLRRLAGIRAFKKITGASQKEVDAALNAVRARDSLLDLTKQKLLKRAGADAFIRARKAGEFVTTPEVFVTNPKAIRPAKYYGAEKPEYLPALETLNYTNP